MPTWAESALVARSGGLVGLARQPDPCRRPVLILASEFAFFAWDWRHRLKDAVSDYAALFLRRGATVAHWDDGSHLSLQGHSPWDHGVSQKKKVSVSETVPTFDWEDANLAGLVLSACWTIPRFALMFKLWSAARTTDSRGRAPGLVKDGLPRQLGHGARA